MSFCRVLLDGDLGQCLSAGVEDEGIDRMLTPWKLDGKRASMVKCLAYIGFERPIGRGENPIGGERERAQFLALAPYRAEYYTGVDIVPVNFD